MHTTIEVFMAKRIIADPTKYTAAITARPDLKIGIDAYLTEASRADLIQE